MDHHRAEARVGQFRRYATCGIGHEVRQWHKPVSTPHGGPPFPFLTNSIRRPTRAAAVIPSQRNRIMRLREDPNVSRDRGCRCLYFLNALLARRDPLQVPGGNSEESRSVVLLHRSPQESTCGGCPPLGLLQTEPANGFT